MRIRYAWNRSSLSRVPSRPGVYVIWGFLPDDRMYIGTSSDLRSRLLQWYERGIGVFPSYATVTIVPNYFQRLALEKKLIKRHRPRYNVQQMPSEK